MAAVLLVISLAVKPRPRRPRIVREGSLPASYHPYKMSLTTWVCLPLAILCSVGGVVLTLTNYWVIGGLLFSVSGLFGGYEKYVRDKRETLYLKQQKKQQKAKASKPSRV